MKTNIERNYGHSSMVAEELVQRLSFLEIDDRSRAALSEYYDDIAQILPDILQKFYRHVGTWPNLKSMFKDQSRMDYARNAQQQHWLKLFSARFDSDYAESVKKIGLIHSRIGLDPTWYIGAYGFTLNHLYFHACQKYRNRFKPHLAQEKTAELLRL